MSDMKLNKFIQVGILTMLSVGTFASCSTKEHEHEHHYVDCELQSIDAIRYADEEGGHNPGELLESYQSSNNQHVYTVKSGSRLISEFKILVEQKASIQDELDLAASEIQYFILQSTGVTLTIVPNNEYVENDHYISIGKTTAYVNSGIAPTKALNLSGVFIKSDAQNVYLIGGEPHGIVYTAYEFLRHEIGFEVYGSGEFTFNFYHNLYVNDFDLVEIPDIDLRICGYGSVQNNSQVRNRMRFNISSSSGKIFMGPDNTMWHNSMKYLPKAEYASAHPKWYSSSQNQLCYTAHGDSNEQTQMFNTFMTKFIEVVNAHPECSTISITQEDYNEWCDCSACTALRNKYGTDAASVILFVNKVSDAIAQYFSDRHINRQIDILFFAYHKTTYAPVTKNSSGQWVPIDSDVVCRDNVCVFYAPISADYQAPFTDWVNAGYAENMDKWLAVTKKLYLWIYGTNFSGYLIPMNNFNSMIQNYKFAYNHGAAYIYDQGQWNATASTGWSLLKSYIQSKAQWNTEYNFNDLVQNWFDNWFRAASAPMKALFDRWNAFTTYMYRERDLGVGCFDESFSREIYPKSEIDAYLSYIDEAYQAIEPLKDTNPILYEKIYNRILLESIAYRYIDYDLYNSYYSKSERERMWNQFRVDVYKVGVSHLRETEYISKLFGDF